MYATVDALDRGQDPRGASYGFIHVSYARRDSVSLLGQNITRGIIVIRRDLSRAESNKCEMPFYRGCDEMLLYAAKSNSEIGVSKNETCLLEIKPIDSRR